MEAVASYVVVLTISFLKSPVLECECDCLNMKHQQWWIIQRRLQETCPTKFLLTCKLKRRKCLCLIYLIYISFTHIVIHPLLFLCSLLLIKYTLGLAWVPIWGYRKRLWPFLHSAFCLTVVIFFSYFFLGWWNSANDRQNSRKCRRS